MAVLMVAAFVLGGRAAEVSSAGVTFDNDFLFPPRNKDWDYTGGMSLEWGGPRVDALHLAAPTRLLDDLIFGWTGALEKFPNKQHMLIIGGTSRIRRMTSRIRRRSPMTGPTRRSFSRPGESAGPTTRRSRRCR